MGRDDGLEDELEQLKERRTAAVPDLDHPPMPSELELSRRASSHCEIDLRPGGAWRFP